MSSFSELSMEEFLTQFANVIDRYFIVSKTDIKGHITYVNEPFCKISKYTQMELLGKPHSIVRHPATPKSVFKKMWETIQGGDVFHGVITNLAKDGTDYTVDAYVIPLKNSDEEVVEYISYRTDITEFVKQKEEEIDLLKDNTVALFTHELKTPLNAIISFSYYIQNAMKKELSEKKRERIQELSQGITANANSLLNIVQTLLDVSKYKQQELVFYDETFDFAKTISEKVQLYRVLHVREVTLDLPPTMVIYSDSKSLNHIFENLFSNALKYSNERVGISLLKDEEQFYLIVEDDGDGIDEENKERIFKAFAQQRRGSDAREKSGTGIGLYLVKILCENNDFSIQIDTSEKFGGARFTISGALKSKRTQECIKSYW